MANTAKALAVGLTRFTHETTSFQGYRVCVRDKDESFTKYYSDRRIGSEKKSRMKATKALKELRALLLDAKLYKGKHTKATIKRGKEILEIKPSKKG